MNQEQMKQMQLTFLFLIILTLYDRFLDLAFVKEELLHKEI